MLIFQLKEENEMNAFFVPVGTENVEEAKLKAKGLNDSFDEFVFAVDSLTE